MCYGYSDSDVVEATHIDAFIITRNHDSNKLTLEVEFSAVDKDRDKIDESRLEIDGLHELPEWKEAEKALRALAIKLHLDLDNKLVNDELGYQFRRGLNVDAIKEKLKNVKTSLR